MDPSVAAVFFRGRPRPRCGEAASALWAVTDLSTGIARTMVMLVCMTRLAPISLLEACRYDIVKVNYGG